jgi:hypothetical protein
VKTNRKPLMVLLALLSVASVNVQAATAECAPEVQKLVTTNATYKKLQGLLKPKLGTLQSQLQAVSDQVSYEKLLATASSLAKSIKDGRVVVTLPDGTVMVDTGKSTDPLDASTSGNSYNHYKTKTVNENHNTRLSIINAQLHPCGVGVEAKWSTSVKAKDIYVANRLGSYLDSVGTARISTTK